MKISVLTPSIRPKGLAIVQRCLEKQTFKDFEWLVEIGLPKRGHDLSAAYNRMLRRAQGDIILSYQDYIRIPEDALQIISDLHAKHRRTFITYPVGKTLDWKKIEYDWRASAPKEAIPYHHWEADFGSAPIQAFYDIGGYDEDFDRGWSAENVNVAERAEHIGYKFIVFKDLKAQAYDHDKKMKHPFRKSLEFNDTLIAIKREEFNSGGWKLNYLVDK